MSSIVGHFPAPSLLRPNASLLGAVRFAAPIAAGPCNSLREWRKSAPSGPVAEKFPEGREFSPARRRMTAAKLWGNPSSTQAAARGRR